ncbi:hypothetical protein [Falsiroseomonas oryzae]|uniref:hypothetical protein n=1 Tax=Falsiroseomonas oryzae TaxID=2766473 RepID=UPI0022EB6969|nr:hypothetical protein [Roseomonas sp. MO-31]
MQPVARRGLLGLAAAGALGACGDLPQPYRGQPGRLAMQLARPPAYRLAVPAPAEAMLTDADAVTFARELAEALQAQEVPAVSGEALPLDWLVLASATREGGQVVPRYAVRDADGRTIGQHAGRPVSFRDWAEGNDEALKRAAVEAAPALAILVARADALRRTGDERAAGAGPPVVMLLPVRGAPGDGNESLTARMAERLAGLGLQVQDQADGAGFAVQGVVSVVPAAARGLQRVEIVWTVSRRDGYDLGRVLQLNEVPTGSLNGLWGDIAFVVADEASGGVRDVIANAGGMPEPAAAAQQAAGAQPPPL